VVMPTTKPVMSMLVVATFDQQGSK